MKEKKIYHTNDVFIEQLDKNRRNTVPLSHKRHTVKVMFDEENLMLILCPKKLSTKKWVIIVKHKIFSTHITYEKRLQAIHTNKKSRFTEKKTRRRSI